MSPEETASVLGYFAAAWPWFEVTEGTTLVWAEHLAGVDGQDAHTAARRIVRSLDRPPPLSAFLAHVKAVSRERRPALPAPSREVLPTGQSARVAGIIAAGMRAAARNVPDHQHRDGAENCPACSTRHERDHAAEVMAVVREHLSTGEIQ